MDVFIEIGQECSECQPFTCDGPIALLRVLDRTLLEHNLELLSDSVASVGIAAGKWRAAIEDLLASSEFDLDVVLHKATPEDSLRLRGDTLYSRAGIATALDADMARLSEDAFRVRYPWNLLEANVAAVRHLPDFRGGQIEDGVTIIGPVNIAEGAVIKSGCYVEGPAYIGPRSVIGPLAHIRPDTIIEADCEIGKAELYDCLIMRGTTCKHQAYIGHSVVGESVNIGAGLITADYRHDAGEHTTIVNGEKIATERKKLGAFIGSDVHTGIGTLIYPGRKLWPGVCTLPGEVVKVDKTD